MRRILITGGTGSLGRALVRRLYDTCELCIVSRDEAKQADFRREFPNVKTVLGDVSRLQFVAFSPTDIIHAAAMKHVNRAEEQPQIAVDVNVKGTANLVALARKTSANFVLVSSDKACAPHTTYGATKLIAERITNGSGYPAVRYGNVIGSRGSIFPLWVGKMQRRERIPVTNPLMTRFFMRLSEAVDLVLYALNRQTDAVFVANMKSVNMLEIAERFGAVDIIGESTAEKLHESLISPDEARSAYPVERGRYSLIDHCNPLRENIGKSDANLGIDSSAAPRWDADELFRVVTTEHDWVSDLEMREKCKAE